jgi:hypothetical protein
MQGTSLKLMCVLESRESGKCFLYVFLPLRGTISSRGNDRVLSDVYIKETKAPIKCVFRDHKSKICSSLV